MHQVTYISNPSHESSMRYDMYFGLDQSTNRKSQSECKMLSVEAEKERGDLTFLTLLLVPFRCTSTRLSTLRM